MNNIFLKEDFASILARLERLTPYSQPLWGKMTVGQMVKHAQGPVDFAAGRLNLKVYWLYKLLPAFYFKRYLLGKPYEQNMRTQPSYLVTEEHDFVTEKGILIRKIYGLVESGKQRLKNKVHPVYGKLSTEEWGHLQWKHLDHHLRQFGV